MADGVSLFVFFVSIGPAVQAGFDWAQLLYFDLKKLNTRCLRALRQRYERSAFHLAWVVGIALWGFACVLGTAITRRNLGDLYWLIGPFFLARSFLALAQIQAFSARRYRALFSSGAVLLAFMVALQVGMPAERYKVLGLALVSVLAAGLLRRKAHAAPDEIFEPARAAGDRLVGALEGGARAGSSAIPAIPNRGRGRMWEQRTAGERGPTRNDGSSDVWHSESPREYAAVAR